MLIILCKSLIFRGGQVRTEADRGGQVRTEADKDGHHKNFAQFILLPHFKFLRIKNYKITFTLFSFF